VVDSLHSLADLDSGLRLVSGAAAGQPVSALAMQREPDLAVAPVVDVPRTPGPAPDLLRGLMVGGEDTVSVVLDGAVDARLQDDLDEMLGSVRSSGVRNIVLELATVTFMDTTGLRFLFDLQRVADEHGGTVRLADPSAAVLDLIELSGAAEVFGLRPVTAPAAADTTEGWPDARPA
jgi:anti-anti-sigma factor